MGKVLIVDDSPVDRRLAGRFLERRLNVPESDADTGLTVLYAGNGRDALTKIAEERPDVVVTDIQMPDISGLDVVLHVRARFPLIPVIVMTGQGSEELAVRALQSGAASYVPKGEIARDLLETVEAVMEAAYSKRDRKRLMNSLVVTESRFVLENDCGLIPPLISYLKENIFRMSGSDDTGLIQTTMALREAIMNAMEHGNLQLDSGLREKDQHSYHEMAELRRHERPYCDRRVHITSRESRDEAIYIIRDEGPGFDTSKLPDPTDPTNMERCSGRGLLLMRSFMSDVRFNATGNEVTLVRRADRNAAGSSLSGF
jgi:CheY-like chemotaxis protein